MADIKMINNYNIKDETARNEIETLRGQIPTNVSELNNDANYITEHQSLEGYATELYVNEAISNIEIPEGGDADLSDYYTKKATDELLLGKADISHNHDTMYYRKYLVDAKINALGIDGYAKKEDLTNWANQLAPKYHTHDEYATKDELGDINAILDKINGEEI